MFKGFIEAIKNPSPDVPIVSDDGTKPTGFDIFQHMGEMSKTIEELKKRLIVAEEAGRESVLDECARQIQEKELVIESLRTRIMELETHDQKYQELLEEKQYLIEQNREKDQQLGELRIHQVNESISAVENVRKNYEQISHELGLVRNENHRLQREFQNSENNIATIRRSYIIKIQELESQLKISESHITHYTEFETRTGNELDSLRSKVTELQKTIDEKTQLLIDNHVMNSQQNSQLSQMLTKREKKKIKISGLREMVKKLESDKSKSHSEIDKLATSLRQAQTVISIAINHLPQSVLQQYKSHIEGIIGVIASLEQTSIWNYPGANNCINLYSKTSSQNSCQMCDKSRVENAYLQHQINDLTQQLQERDDLIATKYDFACSYPQLVADHVSLSQNEKLLKRKLAELSLVCIQLQEDKALLLDRIHSRK